MADIFEEKPFPYLECSLEERSNTADVLYEIDYWHFKPTAEVEAWKALQEMWDDAPPNEQIHYESTAEAINRMRIKQGKPPLNNLRRRRLPRFVKTAEKSTGRVGP
jgi:hypothetical protein